MLRRTIIGYLLFAVLFLGAAFYISFGLAMFLFALFHLASNISVLRPSMLERIRGRRLTDEERASLTRTASSIRFKLYFVATNAFYTDSAIYVMLRDFNLRLIDFIEYLK